MTSPQPATQGKAHILYRILAVAWMGIIFAASSQATVVAPPLFPGMDKLMHMGAYAVLGLFYLLSLKNWRQRLTWKTVALVTLAVTLYGISDEYHQSFVPGRYPDLADILADSLGGFLAAVTVKYLYQNPLSPPGRGPG